MDPGNATRSMGPGVRWFVWMVAVIVGLVNLRALVSVFGFAPGGGSSWLVGAGVSFSDALPSILAVVVAVLVASELVLRRFRREVVSEGYALRCAVAFRALCLGGVLTGGLLAGLWSVDGTFGADAMSGYLSSPVDLLGALVGLLLSGILGAGVGGFLGFLEGFVLALPLAVVLGWIGRSGLVREMGPVRPSGA